MVRNIEINVIKREKKACLPEIPRADSLEGIICCITSTMRLVELGSQVGVRLAICNV